MKRVYLDHAATTPMHPEVIRVMTDVMTNIFGNPSSVHQFGRQANKQLQEMRTIVARSLGVKEHEIIFNSGGTEGDNTALIETALSRREQGKGQHLLTTVIEHPAVLDTMHYLETLGFEVTYLPVNQKGNLSLTDFDAALREDTILVSIMYGNNEIGNLMPIKAIGERLRDHQAVFHTDAVQAYGQEELRPHELGVDLLSVSAHKINGPKGVGFLFKSDACPLPSFIHGGEQEEKRRAGTENVAGISGLGTAVNLLTEDVRERHRTEYFAYQELILRKLTDAEIAYSVNGDLEQKLPHILNLHLHGINNDLLLMTLDLQGIAVSTGSACTAGNIEPSHVLEAMYGGGHPAVKESIRISFGLGNTPEDIDYLCDKLIEAVRRLKKQ